jgi:tRNA nucleotidyltransferase/poly(A) polymerase
MSRASDFLHLLEAATLPQDYWCDALERYPILAAGVSLCREIEMLGGEAIIVGGVVRDVLLGSAFEDVDIATNVDIANVEGHFSARDIGRSKDFGIVSVRWWGFDFEVANYRSESG